MYRTIPTHYCPKCKAVVFTVIPLGGWGNARLMSNCDCPDVKYVRAGFWRDFRWNFFRPSLKKSLT